MASPIPTQLEWEPCSALPQDSLAEDHPVLQPLLEVRSDLFSCDALNPRPQLGLLLWVILLGKLGGQWGDSSGRAPECTPNPSWGQFPPPWDGNGDRSTRMMLPTDAAASEPFQKYPKELPMGLEGSAPSGSVPPCPLEPVGAQLRAPGVVDALTFPSGKAQPPPQIPRSPRLCQECGRLLPNGDQLPGPAASPAASSRPRPAREGKGLLA